jgi:hypothetical protein
MSAQLITEYIPLQYDQPKINEAVEKGNGTVRIKGVLQRANAKNQNGRIYPREILMREAQKYQEEFIASRRALGELDHPDCLSACDVMTYNGWKDIKNVIEGEHIATLNTETGMMEWQPILHVINQPYRGVMYKIKGKQIDVLVTPRHRFIVQDRRGAFTEKTASELYELSKTITTSHLTIPKAIGTEKWCGTDYTTFTLPAVSVHAGTKGYIKDVYSVDLHVSGDAWFEFLGIYLAEGHIHNNDVTVGNAYSVRITQNVGPKADHIRSVLHALSPELEWHEYSKNNGKAIIFYTSDARLHAYLSTLGNKYTKHIPSNIKNASTPLLQKLFNGYLMGDGTTVEYNGYLRTSIFSVSKQLMEDFQEIVLKLGMSSRIKTQISTRAYQFAGHTIEPSRKKPLYRLWIEKSKNIHVDFRFLSIEPVEYDGSVHCVTVPNGTFYARNAGRAFWSGNSSVVNLRNVSHNIVEMHWDGDDLVGTLEILSTPSGNIVKELMRNGIQLGVSSRGMGSVVNIGENTVEVDEDFNLICFDIVSNPSTHGAYLFENIQKNAAIQKDVRINDLIGQFFSELSR